MIDELSPESLAREIAEISDVAASLLREHLIDNNGELLPHVLFSDYARYAVDLAASAPTSSTAHQYLLDILNLLETSFLAGRDDVDELISVSFLEDIENTHVTDYLGPGLMAEMQRIKSGRTAHRL